LVWCGTEQNTVCVLTRTVSGTVTEGGTIVTINYVLPLHQTIDCEKAQLKTTAAVDRVRGTLSLG